MAKTTFVQRILQRPSQTYYEPAPKHYHSVKSDLLEQAAEVATGAYLITHESEDDGEAFFTPLSTPTNSMHLDSRIIAAILPMDKPAPSEGDVNLPPRRTKARRAGKKGRMSAVWEEDEPGDSQSARLTRNNSAASSATARTTTTTTTTTTQLTLPRAAYKPADPAQTLASGKLDLARDGRAQVTMASVEVVRGVASSSALRTLGRRLSIRPSSSSRPRSGTISTELALTSHRSPPNFVPNGSVLIHVHAVALDGLDLQLAREEGAGFVPGRAVVGRVVEAGVGVPREDGRRGEWVIGLADPKKCGALAEFILLDRHRIHRAPPPSVPSSNTLFPPPATSRSGSPTPFGPSTVRSRRSSASSSRSLLALLPGPSLTELALLPLAVSAWRAIRLWTPSSPELTETDLDNAFDDISDELELPLALTRRLIMTGASARGNASPRGTGSPYVASPLASTPSLASTSHGTSLRSPTPRTPRAASAPCAMVLQASSGAGALALVLLRASHPHARLVAHISPGALGLASDTLPAPVCIDLRDWASLADAGLPLGARGADVLARLRAFGAAAAVVGQANESLEASAGADEVGPAVDFVLDTIGGAGVWAAASQLLGRGVGAERGEAMFVTLVGSGDSTRAVPGAQDHWRAARGPPKAYKTRRRVGWAWVPVSAEVDVEGLDVRAGMEAIMTTLGVGVGEDAMMGLAKGQQHRWRALSDVLGGEEGEEVFERAMDAFGPRLEDGRCVVVKVAGV